MNYPRQNDDYDVDIFNQNFRELAGEDSRLDGMVRELDKKALTRVDLSAEDFVVASVEKKELAYGMPPGVYDGLGTYIDSAGNFVKDAAIGTVRYKKDMLAAGLSLPEEITLTFTGGMPVHHVVCIAADFGVIAGRAVTGTEKVEVPAATAQILISVQDGEYDGAAYSIRTLMTEYEKFRVENTFWPWYQKLMDALYGSRDRVMPAEWTYGGYANPDGTITEFNYYLHSGWVRVKAGASYRISGLYGWAVYTAHIYDASGRYIKSVPASNIQGQDYLRNHEFVMPDNASHVVLNDCTVGEVRTSLVETGQTGVQMPSVLAGKKLSIIGDSTSDPAASDFDKYPELLALNDRMVVTNLARAGSGYYKGSADGYDLPFSVQASQLQADTEYVLIFGGFNDTGTALGAIGDAAGTATLFGGLNATFDKIIEIAPAAVIGVVTPAPWAEVNPVGKRGDAIADAIIQACRARGIPYYDLYRRSNLRPWIESVKADLFDEAGVHPNGPAHKKYIYPQIREFLKTLL